MFVDKRGVPQLAEEGPSWGDAFANAFHRGAGLNAIDYVLTPGGIYRIVDGYVQWIAPISYIHPGNY